MVKQATTSNLPLQAGSDQSSQQRERDWVYKQAANSQAAPLRQGYLTRHEAASYLGVSLRWLEGNTSLPKVDIAQPGAKRPTWRYRIADLDAWMEVRLTDRDLRRAR
jgi:hypothetical protein